jgi:hypothetical protein
MGQMVGEYPMINWLGHLDVILFIVVFYPIAIEYLIWRLGNAVLIKIEDE